MGQNNQRSTAHLCGPRWKKGESGNPKGRPSVSRAFKELCSDLAADPKVQSKLLAQARSGKLHPSILIRLLEYAEGKPIERIEHGGDALHAIADAIRAAREKFEGEK